MKQELDSEQIFEQLDGMLRKGERQRRAASTTPQRSTVALNQAHYEEVPRILLTEKMLAFPPADAGLSFDQVVLDDQEVEDLVAQIYADVNAHIETMIPSLIDTALQQRVLEITSTPYKDPSLSH